MPLPPGSRRGRRLVGGLLGAVVVSLVCLVPVSSYADGDDYPYAGLGKCPLVPLPPKAPGTQNGQTKPAGPSKPGGPTKPGPGKPGQPGHGQPGKPSGPPPPRQCAKHIWFYNGSYGDPWGFALRNCTSFVAWRLRMTNGFADFQNHYGGVHWGNAADWDEAATALGYLADDVPAVGAVAQTDHGSVGHVAWVEAVGAGTVTVEEYNYAVAGGYDVRTVPTSSFRYLHLADLGPDPTLGSTRAGVATTDAHGGSWSAHTTQAGDLVVRRPSGRATRLPAPGGWSTSSAPSILTDPQGRVWVAAMTSGGHVLTVHTSAGTAAFGRPRAALVGTTTSSPTLAVDSRGRVHLFAVTGRGTLIERHTAGAHSDRWSRAHRLGLPGSFSTHAAAAVASDVSGRLWVAAVTRHGHLLTQHSTSSGRHWTGFRAADRRVWSATSTPALADSPDGRLWLASVGERGHLMVRHTGPAGDRWRAAERQPGLWSPYSSPAMRVDPRGRTWLAAVGTDGDLTVLWKSVGSKHWRSSRGLPRVPSSETASAALATTVDGVLVGVTDGRGRLVWRRPLGQSGPQTAHGPRGGGLSFNRFL
jgi:surface antigen